MTTPSTNRISVRQFTDCEGRTWRVRITVDEVKRCREQLGIQILDATNPQADLCGRLSTDPELLVNVLYVVCRQQADERGLSDEQFGRSMAGDAIWEASTALLEAVADFFPSPAQRAARHKLIERSTRIVRLLERRLDEVASDGEIDRQIDSLFAAAAKAGTGSA